MLDHRTAFAAGYLAGILLAAKSNGDPYIKTATPTTDPEGSYTKEVVMDTVWGTFILSLELVT